MSFFLSSRPLGLTLGIGACSAFALHTFQRLQLRPILCERSTSRMRDTFASYESDAKVPVVKGGRINTVAYKQISSGSLLGLLCGVAVASFSKTLTFLFGVLIFGAQYLESKGLHVIPTQRIQGYVKGINLQSLVEDNVAFKLSFGATFMLAAFAEF